MLAACIVSLPNDNHLLLLSIFITRFSIHSPLPRIFFITNSCFYILRIFFPFFLFPQKTPLILPPLHSSISSSRLSLSFRPGCGFPGCLVPGCFARPQQHGRSLGGEREHGLDPSPQDGRAGGSPSLGFRWARTLRAPKSTTPSCETTSLKVEETSCRRCLGGVRQLDGLMFILASWMLCSFIHLFITKNLVQKILLSKTVCNDPVFLFFHSHSLFCAYRISVLSCHLFVFLSLPPHVLLNHLPFPCRPLSWCHLYSGVQPDRGPAGHGG